MKTRRRVFADNADACADESGADERSWPPVVMTGAFTRCAKTITGFKLRVNDGTYSVFDRADGR